MVNKPSSPPHSPFEQRNLGELKEVELSRSLAREIRIAGCWEASHCSQISPIAKSSSYAFHLVDVNQVSNRNGTDANKPTKNTPIADFVKSAGTCSVSGAIMGPQDLKGQKMEGNQSKTHCENNSRHDKNMCPYQKKKLLMFKFWWILTPSY